jgi:hypothetical protein
MITQQMDGTAKHLWQNPEGKKFAVRAPWDEPAYNITDKNGVTKHIRGGPAYIRPLKSVFEVAEWGADPVQKFIYKLSPMVSGIGTQLFGSEYRKGYKGIGDIPRRTRDFVLDVSTPIVIDQVIDAAEGKKTPQSAVLPFFGFPVSKLKTKKKATIYK